MGDTSSSYKLDKAPIRDGQRPDGINCRRVETEAISTIISFGREVSVRSRTINESTNSPVFISGSKKTATKDPPRSNADDYMKRGSSGSTAVIMTRAGRAAV